MLASSLTMRLRKLLIVTVAALILIDIASIRGIWSEVQNRRPDFFDLYETGKLFLDAGVPDYATRPAERLNPEESTLTKAKRVDSLHPPFEILIFMALSLLPPHMAYIVWAGCNLLMLWSVPLLLWRSLPNLHSDFHYITIFFGSFIFVFVALVQGQDSILLLFLITVAFILLQKNKELAAGIIFGLGMFKFFIIAPLVVALAISRGRRLVQGWLVSSLALLMISVGVVGLRNTEKYYEGLAHFAVNPATKLASAATTMPNLRGLIVTLFPSIAGKSWGIAIPAILSLLIFSGMLLWARRNKGVRLSLKYAILISFTAVASFHFFLHNAVILLIPLLFGANEFARSNAPNHPKIAFAAAAVSMYVFPNVLPMGLGVPVMAIASMVICWTLLVEAREAQRGASSLALTGGA